MTQDPLVDELRKPEYATLDDQQAADAVNARTVTYRRPADSGAVKATAIRAGYWADIDIGCDSTDAATRRLCRNVRGWLEDCAGKLPTLDVDNPATEAIALSNQMRIMQINNMLQSNPERIPAVEAVLGISGYMGS